MMLSSILVLVFLESASAFFVSSDNLEQWEDLKVHWGANPFSKDNFVHMPRTTSEATGMGFKQISKCDVNANWRGARYVKNDDYSAVLLYDVNGYIAGIQTTVPSGQDNGYPKASMRPPFVKDGDNYVISAYFVDPAIICSKGRTAEEFKSQGTGTMLYIQNGTNAETQHIKVPHKETQMNNTKWTEGKCFYTMGTHYWYDTSKDMSCDDFFPVFLMFNKNELTGFGWALGADLSYKNLEHPGSFVLPLFFKEIPQCLYNYKKLSTMHIFFRESYFDNTKC